jgi:hypothetical protein
MDIIWDDDIYSDALMILLQDDSDDEEEGILRLRKNDKKNQCRMLGRVVPALVSIQTLTDKE